MSDETTASYINNRKNRVSSQLKHWRKRRISGITRLTERILLGQNLSDRLGGNGMQIAHLEEVSQQIEKIVEDKLKISDGLINVSFVELKNVLVDINSGLVKLDNGYILDDYLPHWQNLIYSGGLGSEYKGLKLNSPVSEGLWTSVSDTPYFYHFVIEDLARVIVLFEKYPDLRIAMKSDSQPWKFDLLNYFELPYRTFISSSNRFEKYVTRSGGDHKNLDGLHILKNEASQKSTLRQESPMKFVITRKGFARENTEADTRIVEILTRHGFVEIQPEKLSVKEQIDYFSRASVVVGMHGGSLTNILWCNPNVLVYEIFGHAYRTSDFERLANDMKLIYKPIVGTALEIENKLEVEFSA